MRKKLAFILLLFIFNLSNLYGKAIKNLLIYSGLDKDKKPVIIIIEIYRRELLAGQNIETTVDVKYLQGLKITSLYNDRYISEGSINKLYFKKNILINILEQNQIEIGTTGLNYNFNIISLAQKKRATYKKTINEINYKYYINTAFLGKEGQLIKGNLLFLEAESRLDNFALPDIIFMMDNLNRSWFIARLSNNYSAVLFSDSAELFKVADYYNEANKAISVNMEKGIIYNKSALLSIPQLKHNLEINARTEMEETPSNDPSLKRLYVFSEGYAHTRDGMTSIFGVRIINKKK